MRCWTPAFVGLLLGFLLVRPAEAQVSGSIALVSDYLFRGVSLSDRKPALQTSIAYDHDSGWYGGAFASTVRFDDDARQGAQLMAYLGRVLRLTDSLSWEIGIADSTFSRHHEYDYQNVYAGVAADVISARIHYARHYFGLGADAIYAEINGSRGLGNDLRLVGHFGILKDNINPSDAHCKFDIRGGIGFMALGLHGELAMVKSTATYLNYPVGEGRRKASVALSLAIPF